MRINGDSFFHRIDRSWERDMEAICAVYETYRKQIIKLIKEVEEKEHWV